ncbi:BREX system P-loop protein BrxC [Cytobacillus pseudoceanisediminis]|uniref:BREX system P-loop protein BrxC n=1 Tax=Cytobacillus pseudoceanisediminis TaxID=3051614 RepID=UPI0021849B9E|nr:BREX system P-loop protein BrxC [Cytobacillus pseudoceanisediminis]UQX55099.1 BREX system P-loop protein BrxC [Cytobacillus pseudoceanisediminis]
MTKINEILTLDLQEDIKNVIDLEDRSETEIQQEIESYIVTEGIGRHLYNFTNLFTSNIKETGVWLSGFYGSGKSYFGKMMGYIIGNPIINGTPARDRFIPRLKGVEDESLIENSIRNLEVVNSRVVFLDVAKQNTDKGLAFTLFANLLKNLGFRDDIYGYMEFDLLIDGKLDEFKSKTKSLEGQEWNRLKTSNRQVARVMRKVFAEMGYSEADYADTQKVYSSAIENFSASKFKTELEKYLTYRPEETIVFVFDEASEAISQKKFTLLDLEGISEALSSISNNVWTIAIAQEKLDDVINNANVNRSQLTKLTDRFKTKVHLESTEVDVIIRSRLLHKTQAGYQKLVDYHKSNEGLVSDATNLKSSFPTKTANADEFATYYPFHKYQFDILQKFLFSSNALVSTQIAARGMIITTFDILRKQMRERELYSFTPGYAICTEAQTAPPIGLVNKYDTARKILKENSSIIDGEKLLKTIHLMADSDVISPTVENITKSYISDITTYYDVKPVIEEALGLLLEAKVLLLSNNNYKITSDLEGKLLEEMKDFDVELFSKKRSLINYIKDYKLFNTVATFNDGTDSFKFSVLSDQEDELTGSGSKHLKLTVYSLFNIDENRQDFIENLRLETQFQKDLITLVPDNKEFPLIDKLIGEISRYSYMEEKYSNEPDPAKRQIIRDFSIIREEKEKELRVKIEKAYQNSSLIYMFDELRINADSFKGTISEIQRKMIKNIYTKRLASGLSEGLVPKIFSSRKEDLSRLFSGDDFRFFDSHGNFTGDHLKVVEEVNFKIKSRYVDGRTLESDLSGAPWGYSFGTIVSTLASLFRAGRLSVKYNGDTWFSHKQNGIQEAFTNATKFRSASFKSITATLTAAQKNQAVQLLMDLEIETHTGQKVDWNTNDFDLADSIRNMADHFIKALTTLNDTVDEFESLFPIVADQKQTLLSFTGKVTESNYIEKVEYLLTDSDQFSSAIQTILKAQKFIKKNFSKAREFKRFIEEVASELKKADRSDNAIYEANEEFFRLYKQDMVKNFGNLQQQVQIVKDSYYKLIKIAAARMSHEYQLLSGKVDAALRTLKEYPAELNVHNQKKLDEIKRYCSERIIKEPVLEYSISCKNCGYSLSDILNYTALAPTKENELLIIQSSFVVEAPQPEPETGGDQSTVPKKPRKVRFQVTSKVMTVQEYKSLLTNQLALLTAAKPDEEIELEIETI